MDDPPIRAGVLPVAHVDYAPDHRIFSAIPWNLLERGNAAAAGRRREGTTSTEASDRQTESRSLEPTEHDPKMEGKATQCEGPTVIGSGSAALCIEEGR